MALFDDFDIDDLFRDEFKVDANKFKKHEEEVVVETPDSDGNVLAEFISNDGKVELDADKVREESEQWAEEGEAIEELRRKLMGNPTVESWEQAENVVDDSVEETIQEDAEYTEEVLSGNILPEKTPESKPVQFNVLKASRGEQPWSDKDEYVKGELAIPALEGTIIEEKKDGPSALEIAVAELQKLKDMDIDNEAQENALRAKINETQKLLDGMKAELSTHHNKRMEHKQRVREQESKVSEEAHLQAEKDREEEIKRQRKHNMMRFHSHINDLNPEWKDYAFDHQWEGASTLALHEGGLLADDMGLGKTLTTIMVADMLDTKFNLVITPAETCSNFTLEFAMWAKHRFVYTLAGADKKTRDVFMEMIIQPRVEKGENVTLLINYEQLYGDMDYFAQLLDIPWDAVYVDEFHSAKNQKSLLFQRLKSFRAKGVKRFFPITGTFILNSPDDIWTALHVVDPDAFPTIGQFRDHYCEYNYDLARWVFRSGGERSMLIRLGGRIVKRTMEEAGIKLPAQHLHFVDIEFPQGAYEDQRTIMKQLAEHSQIILDSDRKVSIVEQIALITRQRQCAVWPAGIQIKDPFTKEVVFSVGEEVQESIKLDWVEDKIEKLRAENKRIVVFSQFKTALAEMERRLLAKGFRVARYDGDTTRDVKMVVKRDFDRKHVEKNNGEFVYDIVLCNFKVGGVGLNFTHATEMIMIDEEWNPGKNQQAYKRINRIGQTEETNVWIPQLTGAIDGWMRALNDAKADIISGFDREVDLQKEFSDFLNTVRNL